MLHPHNRTHTVITKHESHVLDSKEDVKFQCDGHHVTDLSMARCHCCKNTNIFYREFRNQSIHIRPLSPGGYLWGK